MSEIIAAYDDFSGGHWGNLGPVKAQPNQWGGRNLIFSAQRDLAPISPPTVLAINSIKNGQIWGMHWAWGVDGRVYYLQSTNTTTAVVFAFTPSATTTVTQVEIGKMFANPTYSPDWVQASSTIYMTLYGYSTMAINALAGSMAALSGTDGAAPGGRAIAIYGERLVIGATTGARFSTVANRIAFSGDDSGNNPTDRTAWESLNYVDVGPPDAKIAGIYPTRDALTVVLDDQTIYSITGTLGVNESIRRVYGFDGGTGAVTAFRANHGAVDPSQTRVWMFDHNHRAPARFNGASYQQVLDIGAPQQDRTAQGWIRGGVVTVGKPDEVAVFGTMLSAESGAFVTSATTTYKRLVHLRLAGVWNVIDQFAFIGDATVGGSTGDYFVQGNNRYQLVLCTDIGSGSTPPQFMIWYAQAPAWGLTVAGDQEFVAYAGPMPYATTRTAALVLPYRHAKSNMEYDVDGILVDYIPVATAFTNQTSTTAVGFTGTAYGYGVPSYSRTATSPATAGLAISTSITYATTINTGQAPSQVNSGQWPDIKTAWLPVRLNQKVRSVKAELSEMSGVRIVSVQVVGKQVQGRVT